MRTSVLLTTFLIGIISSVTIHAKTVKLQGGEIIPEHAITFKEGSAELTEQAKADLAAVKAYLDEKTYVSMLRVEGHVFDTRSNQKLSEGRALAVCAWLVNAGVDCKRLLAVGFADTKPVSGQGDNNRIVLVTAALRGHAIGGLPPDGGGRTAGDACN